MSAPSDVELTRRREHMVDTQLAARGVSDPRVLAAMRRVARHQFVLPHDVDQAYDDHPIDIGHGQTISQPYIVGFMTAALALPDAARVLEIGTGSGYQTAVLAELAQEVYTIEVVPEHAESAAARLAMLGYRNIWCRTADGYSGWPERAPFDGILVAAAADHVPAPLIQQLRIGARLVVPVGTVAQELLVLTRTVDGMREDERVPVRFVPFVRRSQDE